MTAPPPYPRIPHLVVGRGTSDDRVLSDDDAAALLANPVVVEEKIDGANAVVWTDNDRVECALRGGPDAMDRAGQLGPLRAWLAERSDQVRELLGSACALYCEWCYLTHTIAYDRLPAYLIALDLRIASGAFCAVSERNARCTGAGLAVPAELWRGTPGDVAAVEALIGSSRYGPGIAEGVVIRATDDGEPRIAKLIRAEYEPLGDEAWRHGRPRNRLADREASWH